MAIFPTLNIRKLLEDEIIAGTSSITTKAFTPGYSDFLALYVKGSGTSPNVRIVREYSFEKTPNPSTWVSRDLEGNEDVVVENFTQTDWTATPEVPTVAAWVRYRITGNVGNGSDTKISLYILALE
jgi:hypothetical protein